MAIETDVGQALEVTASRQVGRVFFQRSRRGRVPKRQTTPTQFRRLGPMSGLEFADTLNRPEFGGPRPFDG